MGFWEITKKDLKLLVRDRRTTALLIVLPLVFITIIGLTTGKLLGWKRSNQILRIGFVDEVDYQSIETI
jgi:ABC-2 type transport system permease protein